MRRRKNFLKRGKPRIVDKHLIGRESSASFWSNRGRCNVNQYNPMILSCHCLKNCSSGFSILELKFKERAGRFFRDAPIDFYMIKIST